jgi:hypothetical protein
MANSVHIPRGITVFDEFLDRTTSKWNKIEHRLFSFISLNWRGTPLVSYETVVNLIGGTTTKTGLKVKAILDRSYYETGLEVTSSEMEQIQLRPHKKFPNWN